MEAHMITDRETLIRKEQTTHEIQIEGISAVLKQCSNLAVRGVDFGEQWKMAEQMLSSLLAAMEKAKGKLKQ
jgi:hypothetical protein